MPISTYVALSGQVAVDNRLEALANNVANMNTAGYKAETIRFRSVLAGSGTDAVDYVDQGTEEIDLAEGPLVRTENPLDVALNGDGWLAVSDGGRRVYTRDGRMRITPDGRITTLLDRPVLDPGGQPLQIDPTLGEPVIGAGGEIVQDGQRVGALGIFRFDPGAVLSRHDGSGIVSDVEASPVMDFADVRVRQGFVEQSNVNPVAEMTRLVMVQRAFEQAANAVETTEGGTLKMIRDVGAPPS